MEKSREGDKRKKETSKRADAGGGGKETKRGKETRKREKKGNWERG